MTRRTVRTGVALAHPRCGDWNTAIAVLRRGSHARVTVAREALNDRPAGWLAEWTATLEAQGCVAPGGGVKLAARIAESLPLHPSGAFHLLYRDGRQSPFVDLSPGNRLQVDSPILREGASAGAPVVESATITGLSVAVKTSPDLIGYERAWYAVRAKPRSYGCTIVPIHAESHVQGSIERRPEPRVNHFQFGDDAAVYRLFYRGDRTIVVVSAPTQAELEHRTRALREDPGACTKFPARSCIMIPRNVGVNAAIVAVVNGRELPLPAGTNVASAIRAAGEARPENLVPQLTLRKPFDGRLAPVVFDRGSTEILSVALVGGEEISWR